MNEATFLSTVLAMRPKPVRFNPDVHPWKPDFHVQEKLDGYRCTIIRNHDTDEHPVQIIGRKKYLNLWTSANLQHQHALAECILALPPRTVLDGEYYDALGRSTDVPTLMREGRGLFVAWAMPWYDGKSNIQQAFNSVGEQVEPFVEEGSIKGVGFVPVASERLGHRTYDDLLAEARTRKIEGFVVKRTMWADNGWKVKPLHTFDLLVTGFVEGESANRGKIGSLQVSARLPSGWIIVGKCGGLDAETRCLPFASQLDGRVVEVQSEGFTTHGKLKFARLVRFRDDLTKEDVDVCPTPKENSPRNCN